MILIKSFKTWLLEQTFKYPDGVYIGTSVSNETNINIKNIQYKFLTGYELCEDLHCTVIYSPEPNKDNIETKDYSFVAKFKKYSLFGEENDTLVIELDCKDIVQRNKELKEKYGFTSNYAKYSPHVTLAYNCKDIDLNMLPKIDFNITLNNEQVEPLDEDWNN